MVIAGENISSGMGTTAFVAFLMSLCNRRFSATQFALLSAFASIGRVWVGPLAGVLAQSIGWPAFFLVSIVAAVPALALLAVLRRPIDLLERSPEEAERASLTGASIREPPAAASALRAAAEATQAALRRGPNQPAIGMA